MLPKRLEAFDFSRPFGEEKWMIMMSRPQETTDGDGLIAPFQPEVQLYHHLSIHQNTFHFYIFTFYHPQKKIIGKIALVKRERGPLDILYFYLL